MHRCIVSKLDKTFTQATSPPNSNRNHAPKVWPPALRIFSFRVTLSWKQPKCAAGIGILNTCKINMSFILHVSPYIMKLAFNIYIFLLIIRLKSGRKTRFRKKKMINPPSVMLFQMCKKVFPPPPIHKASKI